LAGEAGLAGGAELAVHRTTGLGRDADGDPVAVRHQHRLDLGATGQGEQPLDSRTVVGGAPVRLVELGAELFFEPSRNASGRVVISAGRSPRR